MKADFLVGLILLMSSLSCAPEAPRTALSPKAQIKMGSVVTPASKPIPVTASVLSVNARLVGNYTLWQIGCQNADGFIPTPYDMSQYIQTLRIQDKAIAREIDDPETGCHVTVNYSIIGVDSKAMVVGNQSVVVSLNDGLDSQGICSPITSVLETIGSGNIRLDYLYDYSGLWIYSDGTDACESGEQDVKLFTRN